MTEFLRCPEHCGARDYCVLMPETVEARDVRAGTIACPACQATYPIVDGIADFRGSAEDDAGSVDSQGVTLPAAEDVRALLGVAGPGGYIVALGSACLLVPSMTPLVPGVHFVLVNPPGGVASSGMTSRVRCRHAIPLAPSMARGVVIGHDHARAPWLAESARLLLRGLRVVVVGDPGAIDGVKRLASGQGMWVGEKH